MTPVRVVPPSGPVVPLSDLKAHLRVSGSDSDTILEALERQAVAHLDGWRGVLGRCILPQTWEVRFPVPGAYHLPFPDIVAVTDQDGVPLVSAVDSMGQTIASAPLGPVRVTCALPEDALDAVRGAIIIWVQMRYDALEGTAAQSAQRAFDALIGPVRWMRA